MFEVGKKYHHPSTPSAIWLCKGVYENDVWMSQGRCNSTYHISNFGGYVEYIEPPKPIVVERWIAFNHKGAVTVSAWFNEADAKYYGVNHFGTVGFAGVCKLTGEFTPNE